MKVLTKRHIKTVEGIINISGIDRFNYLIDPRIYYSGTHLDFSVLTFLYRAFTVLYLHSQHAFVTSVKVFVNTRCFKKSRSFICVISAHSFDKNNHYTTHTVSRSAMIFQAEILIRCNFEVNRIY